MPADEDLDLPIRPFVAADLLLLLPFVWQLGFAFWANEVTARPFGMPFMMVWQMAGILLTTAAIAWRYWLDRHKPEDGQPSAAGQSAAGQGE